MAEKCEIREGYGEEFLTSDVLRDVFRRVNGATLARLSAVSRQFRSEAHEEPHWERLCNDRWPSTKHAAAKTLIASAGGYRKFYSNCFPFVTPRHSQIVEESCTTKAEDFLSLVDVVCGGEPVLSRVLDGLNGADALFGPLVDVTCESCSIDAEHSQMRLSWILVHKKTLRMVNLSSWTPISTLRHRGYGDDDVLLCFAAILPNPSTTISNPSSILPKPGTTVPILCNILMRCNLHEVMELGFTLEAGDGVHVLRGRDAVDALSCAVACCDRTLRRGAVAALYREFVAEQTASRRRIIRREGRRHRAIAMCFVGVVAWILFSFCYKPSP